jgi:zinc transporter ZupT
MEVYHHDVLSFSGGILIAMIFLVLIPEVIELSNSAEIFLLMLLGYMVFHNAEKYLYQHVKDKKHLLDELKELHSLGFFLDHFILGFILVTVLKLEESLRFLILLPIFLHTISSSISLDHIHEKAKTHVNKIILSLAPLLGALTALVLEIEAEIQGSFLAFAIGMLIYIVNRDILPKGEKGRPIVFSMGAIIVIITWFLIEFS